MLSEQADSGVCGSPSYLCSAVSPCLPRPRFPYMSSREPSGKPSNASPGEKSKDLVCNEEHPCLSRGSPGLTGRISGALTSLVQEVQSEKVSLSLYASYR